MTKVVQLTPPAVKWRGRLFAPPSNGTINTMCARKITEQNRAERMKRAERLTQARKNAGYGGVKSASAAFGWNVNNYKAHESGQNGFSSADAKIYAQAFGVSLNWLFLGVGEPSDADERLPQVIDVPLISKVSAGRLVEQDGIADFSEFPTVPAIDLPEGDWIALRVDGDSMNKISPPESIIFANRRDKHLVHNACYIISDEAGAVTYKRYRQNEAQHFQPASYHDVSAPLPEGIIRIVARVRRSVIDL